VDGTESKDRLLGDKAPDALGNAPDALVDALTALDSISHLCAGARSIILPQQLPDRLKESVAPFAPVSSSGLVIALASMVGIENKPNPCAGVVHPAKIQDDSGVVGSDRLVTSSAFGQDDGGKEDGEGDC
jgi:hypothetical protein